MRKAALKKKSRKSGNEKGQEEAQTKKAGRQGKEILERNIEKT